MRLSAITPAGRKQGGSRLAFGAAGSRASGVRASAARTPRPAVVRAGATARSAAAARTATVRSAVAPGRVDRVDRVDRAGRTQAAATIGHPRRLRPRPAPSAPRRVSGPLRRDRPPAGGRQSTQPRAPGAGSLAARVSAFVRALPDHALVDRLVRGRAWIPVLGVMLAGIVTMQVEVLKLGASVGRSIERGSTLQTRNELLRASVASLGDESRIERLAAGMGMIMPAPGAAGFLSGRVKGNLSRALANIHAPSASTFLTANTSTGSVATSSVLSSSAGSIAADTPAPAPAPGSAGTTSTTGTAAGTSSSTAADTAAPATTSPATTSPATTAPATTAQTSAQQSSGTQPSTGG